jgi:hypothetical protein
MEVQGCGDGAGRVLHEVMSRPGCRGGQGRLWWAVGEEMKEGEGCLWMHPGGCIVGRSPSVKPFARGPFGPAGANRRQDGLTAMVHG